MSILWIYIWSVVAYLVVGLIGSVFVVRHDILIDHRNGKKTNLQDVMGEFFRIIFLWPLLLVALLVFTIDEHHSAILSPLRWLLRGPTAMFRLALIPAEVRKTPPGKLAPEVTNHNVYRDEKGEIQYV